VGLAAKNCSVSFLPLRIGDRQFDISPSSLMARPEVRTYDSGVVAKRGAGMNGPKGILVLSCLARARLNVAWPMFRGRCQGGHGNGRPVLDEARIAAREIGLASIERRAVALPQ